MTPILFFFFCNGIVYCIWSNKVGLYGDFFVIMNVFMNITNKFFFKYLHLKLRSKFFFNLYNYASQN
ncbi:hypothetical protein C2G38_2055627 [Gigaspora rosea]|uniref:Uncharacterized protein n=1 Tax=Gigaspora rosea TaxID=44941 RepID=A0A397W577_9GLOM|nr:hypothetical protein C2G38_2055627 [Gigaspora rosea]